MGPEISSLIDRSDDVFGGVWGNHISWLSPDRVDLSSDKPLRAYGHKPVNQMPEVGHKIAGEFARSWVMFEVLDVERKTNPPDMFFIDLRPIERVMKPETNGGRAGS